MNYSVIKTGLYCSAQVYEALRDALSLTSVDFTRQTELELSSGFRRKYPPTRDGEPLSGIWDAFDPLQLGYSALEWREPGVEVSWFDGHAQLSGVCACMERVLPIVQHVCVNQLPVILEWVSADRCGRSEHTISKAALISVDAIQTASSATIADLWRKEVGNCQIVTGVVETIAEIGDDVSGYIDVYLAEDLGLDDCADRYAAPLNAALRSANAGCVEQSDDGAGELDYGVGAEMGSALLVIANHLDRALPILRAGLIAAGCRVGCQIQYEVGRRLLFETFEAAGWSAPKIACVIDSGRAYDGEVWRGGVPACM